MSRVFELKNKLIKGFTEKYQIEALVYYEWFTNIEEAIKRAKQLKKWNRAWKLYLIEKKNPQWIDLSAIGYQFPATGPDLGPGFPHSRE